jgi:hypothetical protein
MITRHRVLALQHYDLASLMAGKVHALLTRSYHKGRDWYDLLWYRGLRPPMEPNRILLQNALDQTLGAGRRNASNWRSDLASVLKEISCTSLQSDVRPFLEHLEDADLLEPENLRSVLE